MRIVLDSQIPLAEKVFASLGDVVPLPGQSITAEAVADADVLIVRSVTRVDSALLEDSRVRFVGTATIGSDHVDAEYLASHGITFAHAPGSNARSVSEYVVAAILACFANRGQDVEGRVAGVVGLGAIGSLVEAALSTFGMEVLCCDPPKSRMPGAHRKYHPLSVLLDKADLITLHVPLTETGIDPTRHLIAARAFERLRSGAWLINTSRGAVVDNQALLAALEAGKLGGAVLDVWENEPTPDRRLISQCAVATPHIAGYSFDGKVRGALMIAHALADWLGELADPTWESHAAARLLPRVQVPSPDTTYTSRLDAIVKQMYDIRADDAAMRRLVDLPEKERAAAFTELRANYPIRRSFEWYRTAGEMSGDLRQAVLQGLGVGIDTLPGQER